MRNIHLRRLGVACCGLLMAATTASAVAPTDNGVGSNSAAVNTSTPGLPTGAAEGDLLVMYCESDDGDPGTSCTGNCDAGWTEFINVTGNNGSDGSRLQMFYQVADASPIVPTMGDSGDHTSCIIQGWEAGTYGSNPNTGSPFVDVSGTEQRNTDNTALSQAMGTSTGTDCWFVWAVTNHPDGTATTVCTGVANATLGGPVAEIHDLRFTAGNGGSRCIAKGSLASAGSGGTFSITMADSGSGGEAYYAICASIPSTATRRIFSIM